MRAFLKILMVFLCTGTSFLTRAQEEEKVPFEEVDTILNKVILKKEISGGGIIHTKGWGILFRKGYNVTAFRRNIWELEFVGLKSQKQLRINFYGASYSNANSYIYGKLNKVYTLRAGLGQQYMVTRKPYWGGVEVRVAYYGGLSIGIAKPIYLYIIDQNDYTRLFTERYDPEKHFIENIYGRAPFIEGLDKTQFYPGMYGKVGLSFDFSEYNTSIKALEAGVIADVYAIPIPIMAFSPKNYYFLNFYLNLTFGKRYNKY
jgi:hypothetical protein